MRKLLTIGTILLAVAAGAVGAVVLTDDDPLEVIELQNSPAEPTPRAYEVEVFKDGREYELTCLMVVAAWAAFALPAEAKAQSVHSVAKQECREDRRQDRAEFDRDYGGTDTAALRRCVREEKREARRDCREERREDPAEYCAEYGTGKAASRRCVIDELR
jgi:hypothetical protein